MSPTRQRNPNHPYPVIRVNNALVKSRREKLNIGMVSGEVNSPEVVPGWSGGIDSASGTAT